MENCPNNYSCLDLTIAMPGFSSSQSLPSSGESGGMKELDINQVPSSEEECMVEEEEEESPNNGGPAPRKKLRLTKEQSRLLEESFRQNQTLNLKQKEILAEQLHLKQRQVEVWFQNRRARSKLKQTEMECEYLKRWFGSLTEQNRKLQKEVEELRAVKLPPASTLTMCPRCERVTTTTPTILAKGPTTATTNSNMLFLQSSAACYN
ncbi:homeobox-leucine zipper protein athb-17 [Phtheirospermum japonicum]|uniref:Homeobox-leucine zipper protein athb-17 n=1 Tax=Phtheirospermum japonicum TaxID=374723 RepID=A0A830BBT6_9LAMI|nr:homeobox-leucine zipper protein athb-17 [Phtheirospermum japonicum]